MRHLLLALPLIGLSPLAAGDDCDQLPKPTVTIKRLEAPVNLDTRSGYKALTVMGAATVRPGNVVLGLTRGKAVMKFETKTPSYRDPTGRWECASPQITLSYGFTPMTVLVAREFPAGTCAYKEIYEHEQRHVKTYQDHIVAIEKDLSETLTRRFAGDGPWRGPAGQIAARLQQELDERWLPYVKREIDKAEQAQALIDTPEEYARVTASCDGEIKKLLGG